MHIRAVVAGGPGKSFPLCHLLTLAEHGQPHKHDTKTQVKLCQASAEGWDGILVSNLERLLQFWLLKYSIMLHQYLYG